MIWRPGVAIVIGIVVFGCASSPPPRSEPSPLLGDIAPNFESTTLSGNPLYSTAFHGNPFVVTFVKSQCAPCEKTLAAAQATYFDLRDVPVIGVFGEEDDATSATAISSKLALKFPVVVDEHGLIAKRFAVDDVPRTFVVDPNGRIRWVGGAAMNEGSLTDAVRAVD